MYVENNPKTKAALKALVEVGKAYIYSPGLFAATENGRAFVEGPHAPEPHRWYAEVWVVNGKITKVLS